MPVSTRHPHNCRSILTGVSLILCIRVWVTSSFSLYDLDRVHGSWAKTEAVIVDAINMNDRTDIDKNNTGSIDMNTATGNIFFRDVYCALLNYTVADDYITIISSIPSDCDPDPLLIPVGRNFELRYNPLNPRDFIKQSEYYDDVTNLVIRIVLSLIMSMSLVSFHIRYRNLPDEMERDHRFARNLEPIEPQESPEARKERILSKMIFQSVKEDLSNTTAAAVRSLAKETSGMNKEEANPRSHDQDEEELKTATVEEDDSDEEVEDGGSSSVERRESNYTHSITIEHADGTSSSPEIAVEEEDLERIGVVEKGTAANSATGDEIPTSTEKMDDPLDLEAQTEAGKPGDDLQDDLQDDLNEEKGSEEASVICLPTCPENAAAAAAPAAETRTSAGGRILQSMFASWRRVEESDCEEAECCICLDGYDAGDIIGASKNVECNHVFHKDCIMDWMTKNHNQCPLCRVDLLK